MILINCIRLLNKYTRLKSDHYTTFGKFRWAREQRQHDKARVIKWINQQHINLDADVRIETPDVLIDADEIRFKTLEHLNYHVIQVKAWRLFEIALSKWFYTKD